MSNFIEYKESKLFYHKSGTGQKRIFLFHGFGQDHRAFNGWLEKLNDYTVYGFDLFYHGKSDWQNNKPVEKEDWKKIMTAFFEQEKITDFEMAGFSLGGKFVLATLEIFPERIKKIILVAPDGIKINFWYRLATYPFLTRALFRSFIFKPKIFFSLINLFSKTGLVSKYLTRFASSQMDTDEKRKRVYQCWVGFRHLKFNIKKMAHIINDHTIQLLILAGKYDKVIPAKDMHRLLKFVEDGKLYEIDSGHNQLIEKATPYL